MSFFDRSCFLQDRIQDFPQAAPTPRGTPTYYLAKFFQITVKKMKIGFFKSMFQGFFLNSLFQCFLVLNFFVLSRIKYLVSKTYPSENFQFILDLRHYQIFSHENETCSRTWVLYALITCIFETNYLNFFNVYHLT